VKRLLSVLGALVLVGAVVAVVVWQRPEAAPSPPAPLKDLVVRYADGSPLWNGKNGDPKPPLVVQVLAELRQRGSLDQDDLERAGATVLTTIDPKAQAAGTSVVDATAAAQPNSLRYSLTAVDPATGGVTAYVPGARSSQGSDETDYAGGVLKEPGSAFYPLDVVAGMREGFQLDAVFDGRSPRKIGGVSIEDDALCGERCTVHDALAKSSAVVMFDLVTNKVGMKKMQDLARQAGVPESVVIGGKETKLLVGAGGNLPNAAIALGVDEAAMRPLDLTTVYATFAAGGAHRRTHFVTEVLSEDGGLLYKANESATAAFAPDAGASNEISSRVTTVLKSNTLCPGAVCLDAVPSYQGGVVLGTESHAWTVGYTGRMAITVLVTDAEPKRPAKAASGQPLRESDLPRTIWQGFAAQI
jgi:membrane peptidoglycan carboxypeptidase